jgi:hypothetical protein
MRALEILSTLSTLTPYYMSEPRKPRAEHCCCPPNSKAATGFYDQPKLHKFKINGIEIEAPNKKTAIKIYNRLKQSKL